MSPPLPVELNRDRRHEIRVAETYEAGGPFFIDLHNHGDAVHVHVNVEDDLAEVARVAETNHYVDGDATVRVEVDPVDDPVTGRLKLATGYGGEEAFVDVTVTPFEGEPRVPVGEELGTPSGASEADDSVVEPADETDDGPPVQVLVVAGGAVLLAAGVAVAVGGRTVALGAGVVVLAAALAVGLSLR